MSIFFKKYNFKNYDAILPVQQHHACNLQETFYLKVPSTTKTLPEDYVVRVKMMHESGGHGSKGYQYEWKREEAIKSVLITHTTDVFLKMPCALATKNHFQPKKYYFIDRVFRNEVVDKTHLAKFHQAEGMLFLLTILFLLTSMSFLLT